MRGTFGNIRLRNQLVPGKEGPYTVHLPDGEETFIFDAAMRYKQAGTPLVHPGRQGVRLRARLATGRPRARPCSGSGPSSPSRYERIHRSNLVGMGVLPAPVQARRQRRVARPDRPRDVHVRGPGRRPAPRQSVTVVAERDVAAGGDGSTVRFEAIARLDGPIEVDYYRQGGILPAVLRRLARES